ncbi:hypothetical protein M9Y10_031003 [Tritrichomonas musculus]|uniref:Uncharacterized protein n=1 Tax=Tritrichomonas musculus TaxID=1915356 RepID=A0ABR2H1J8_9EUKA
MEVFSWVREQIVSCLSFDAENGPSFDSIFETLKANKYDLFSDTKNKNLSSRLKSMKKEIEERSLRIEAYEFQHQND